MPERVNNFAIKIATVNGTGSASANTLLMKSIFRSGVPVMGKNYFPSNIQGLPTWYEIRVTKDSYVARSGKVDLMVAMNADDALEQLLGKTLADEGFDGAREKTATLHLPGRIATGRIVGSSFSSPRRFALKLSRMRTLAPFASKSFSR